VTNYEGMRHRITTRLILHENATGQEVFFLSDTAGDYGPDGGTVSESLRWHPTLPVFGYLSHTGGANGRSSVRLIPFGKLRIDLKWFQQVNTLLGRSIVSSPA
jgi:hypothetical protein